MGFHRSRRQTVRFLFANCFFFPLCLKIVDPRSTCCIITAYCFYYYYYYSLCARESFCRQTRLNIRLKWKLNVHIIDCAQKESGLFVWVRLSRRRRQRIGDERDFFFFLKKKQRRERKEISIFNTFTFTYLFCIITSGFLLSSPSSSTILNSNITQVSSIQLGVLVARISRVVGLRRRRIDWRRKPHKSETPDWVCAMATMDHGQLFVDVHLDPGYLVHICALASVYEVREHQVGQRRR